MGDESKGEITRLLEQIRSGDEDAKRELFVLVRDELRRMAGGPSFQKRPAQTLQPTDLVGEAYLRLVPGGGLGNATNRKHFYGMVSTAMRNILVDHERARKARKRGGDVRRVPLDDVLDAVAERQGVDVLDLDEALTQLQAESPRASSVVEMKYFGGMTDREVAENLGVSVSTVQADFRLARAWLKERLRGARG